MAEDSRLVWFERLVRTRQWGQAEHFMSIHARNLWDSGAGEEAIVLCRECADILLQAGGIGEASDMFNHAALWLMDLGNCDSAASIFVTFADNLRERKLFGWAASRYYDGALAYVAKGKVKEATRVLASAEPHYRDIPGEVFWQRQFARDLAILNRDASDIIKLTELESAFRQAGRDDWARRCQSGLSFLATGRIVAA